MYRQCTIGFSRKNENCQTALQSHLGFVPHIACYLAKKQPPAHTGGDFAAGRTGYEIVSKKISLLSGEKTAPSTDKSAFGRKTALRRNRGRFGCSVTLPGAPDRT